MATLRDILEQARRQHEAGQLVQAQELYQEVLRQEPNLADVWQMVADARQALGKYAEAAAAYENVLRLQPDHPEARTSLGVALAHQGKLDDAVAMFREAVRHRPDYAKAHHNLGVALAQQGKPAEAVTCFEQALAHSPDYAEACYNLGLVLGTLKKLDASLAAYRRAIQLRPGYYDAHNNLGLALLDAEPKKGTVPLASGGLSPFSNTYEAAVHLAHAVRLKPDAPEAHNNLGLALAELGRFAEAEACYHEALCLNPSNADAHSNLGNLYKDQGRLDEAIASYGIALAYQPELVSAHWNRALAWLQAGDFEQGWQEYEWRWRRPQTPPRRLREPAWDGAPLDGRTILIYTEQGLGDMIQFIRYAALVKERGGKVLVECPAFLIPLFSSCPGIDQLVAEGTPLPAFDVHAPLMSLARLCGTTLATIPAKVPYLFAKPELVNKWKHVLGADIPLESRRQSSPDSVATDYGLRTKDFKIGIAWQGNPHHKGDRQRSIPLAEFAALARIPGVELISLQKGPGVEQLRGIAGRFAVVKLDGEVDAGAGAFMDTAAVMQHLDLVITSDTAIAHLAGALGVRVWLALPKAADWRWLSEREESPWYPTMRLFRQREWGCWKEVFQQISAAIVAERVRAVNGGV